MSIRIMLMILTTQTTTTTTTTKMMMKTKMVMVVIIRMIIIKDTYYHEYDINHDTGEDDPHCRMHLCTLNVIKGPVAYNSKAQFITKHKPHEAKHTKE